MNYALSVCIEQSCASLDMLGDVDRQNPKSDFPSSVLFQGRIWPGGMGDIQFPLKSSEQPVNSDSDVQPEYFLVIVLIRDIVGPFLGVAVLLMCLHASLMSGPQCPSKHRALGCRVASLPAQRAGSSVHLPQGAVVSLSHASRPHPTAP